MFDVQTIPVLTLPSVPFAERRGLPRCAAIYFVLNAQDTVLYVGRSVSLAARWAKHHRAARLIEHQATRIAWLVMDDAALLTSVEEACLAYFEPVCNTAADARGRPTGSGRLGKVKRVTVQLPEALYVRLEAYAEGRSVARGGSPQLPACVREAIEHYLACPQKHQPRAHAVTDTVTDTTQTRSAP